MKLIKISVILLGLIIFLPIEVDAQSHTEQLEDVIESSVSVNKFYTSDAEDSLLTDIRVLDENYNMIQPRAKHEFGRSLQVSLWLDVPTKIFSMKPRPRNEKIWHVKYDGKGNKFSGYIRYTGHVKYNFDKPVYQFEGKLHLEVA